MKTLKKSLCLVLALVMVLGLGVISASADLDYEDTKDITYAEAVDVMSGIGVLEGYTDGTFLPTKEVSREEAAKIIAYLMVGDSTEADALTTTTNPFSDVSKDRWSAGYIAYLVQEGVIDGIGDGKFDPTGKVTGLQFAKMLLTALGYGVNDEYVGSNWAINVAKDALQYGIFDGNLGGANNTAATREECALYAYNTLWLNKVTYSALLGGYVENSFIWANNAESNKADSFANDFGLWIEAVDSDAFCRPDGYVYKVGKKVITNTYGADAYLEGAYTTPITGNELYNLLGASLVKKLTNADNYREYVFTVYVDGMFYSVNWDISKANTDVLELTGYGVETSVYVLPKEYTDDLKTDDDYVEVRICIVDTLLAEVVEVQEETTKKDAKTTVEIAAIPADDHLDVLSRGEMTYETEAFDEGELVLITFSCKDGALEVQTMVPATLTDAKITKYTNKGVAKVTADGETYTGAENDFVVYGQRASEINEEEVKGKTYTLILDEYGYIIGITEEAVATEYAYVTQFGQKIDTTGDLSDYTTLSAKIWVADPESKTGASSKIVLVDWTKSDLNAKGFDPETFDYNYDELIDALNKEDEGALGLYTIKMSGGKAILSRDEDEYTEALAAVDAPVYKGISRIYNPVNGIAHYATTKTTFFYVTGSYNTETVYVYTGINKVPAKGSLASTQVESGFAAADDDTGVIYDAMAVRYTDLAPADGSTIYFYTGHYTKIDNEDGTYTVIFDVYNGKDETTVEFTYKSASAADSAIKTAQESINMFVKESSSTLKPANKEGYVDVGYLCEMHNIGDVYETTLYTDFSAEVAAYLENAKIVDLCDAEVSTMRGLQKLAEAALENDAGFVKVAFAYNTKTLEISTVYILDDYVAYGDVFPES